MRLHTTIVDAYTWDEVSSLRVAGGAQYGPFKRLAHAGRRLDGVRHAGLSAAFLTYRAGRDLFGPFAGLAAAGVLALPILIIHVIMRRF
jgi:hypothetical protein